MPTARTVLSTSVVDGKIYAIGGDEVVVGSSDIVEIYDPATDTWRRKTDMPTARITHAAGVVDGIIYVIGGFPNGVVISTVEAYNPMTDAWIKKADMPTPRGNIRDGAGAVNGTIYVFGGISHLGGAVFSIVEAYDTGVGIRVMAFSPQTGRIEGGESISISGSGFPPDVIVTIGGNPLNDLQVTNTLLTGFTPPGVAGEQELLITAPAGFSDVFFAEKFFYIDPSSVVLTGMTPSNGAQAGGERGSITGSGFQGGAAVEVGGALATDVTVTPTLITFTMPPGTEGTADVVVTNPDGQSGILRGGYTYNPFPVIERVTLPNGRLAEGPLSGSTPIAITGQHFIQGAVVDIGGTPVGRLDIFSPTALHLQTPSGTAGAATVRVINPDGQFVTKPEGFTYNPAPTISRVSPDAGALEGGTPILITGTGFLVSLATTITIGGIEASDIDILSPTRIFVRTPPSQTRGPKDVVVVNRDGQAARLKGAFTYNPVPAIKSITPDNGKLAGGTRIVIEGSGFLPGAQVLIGDIRRRTFIPAASPRVVSPTRITAITPKVVGEPGARDVVVQNPDRQVASVENGFTYNPLPVIREISPDYGPADGGTRVVIIGSHFLPGAQVRIGRRPATTVVVQDPSTIEAVTPPNPEGLWTVSVINPDEQAAIRPEAFRTVGEEAYNYPNPVRRGGQTTFRYVTNRPVRRMQVRVYNMEGEFIAGFDERNTTEIRWPNVDIHVGLYAYLMEMEFQDDTAVRKKRLLEVR